MSLFVWTDHVTTSYNTTCRHCFQGVNLTSASYGEILTSFLTMSITDITQSSKSGIKIL